MSMAAVGNVDVDEQHQLLVSSLVSQGLPPAGRSESLPVQAGADSAAQHAQHAQQIESAPAGQQVKRKPGRPKKAGLGELPHKPSIPPSSNGHMAPPSAAPVNTDAAVVSTHQVSASASSPQAQLSPRRGIPEAELDPMDHPAGRGRAGSHGPELPLSILLDGSSNKKRGRPYKNAANAEKAAERAARRAATEAAEKAAYDAAAEAAQVVITAPAMLPVKKRRGRPPKDPAKLAAALAAYHASTTARQVSMEAEEAFLNEGARQKAAQAAAQAPAEEPQLQAAERPQLQAAEPPQLEEVAHPAPAITPKPVRKKRGRPPKAVAKAVVDNLNSPSDSLPIAALAGDYAFRQDAPNSIEEEDHDQAILDAAAVLTSSLPYPQEIAVRPSPMAKQGRRAKGKRRSSNSSADAPQPAAAHKRPRGRSQGTSQQWHPTRDKQLGGVGQMAREPEQERHRPPVREQQNQGERQQDREGEQSQERSRRRQLEVVSSRATAILESIGPDSQPLAGADMPNPDSHPVPGPPSSREYPSPGSDTEPAAPPQSGYPSKRHKPTQPATAASASIEEEKGPALDGVSGGRHDRAATKAQRPSTSSASPPAAAKLAAGSSVGHQQEASTKKGSSDSEPALTQTTSRDADRGRTEARVETPPRPSRSQHLQEQLRDLRPTEPVQTQQAQHEAQHSVQQAAQPAFQPPVLALLISGIPPIVLGTFQGDMQRARIILEAAGFLLPVDLSSSLLPPNLNSSPPLQRAAAPAVHALPAGLQTAQAAVQGGVYTSGEDEEEGLPVRHAAVGGVEQAVTEGASLRGAHRRKQTRPGEQPARGSKPLSPAVHQDAGRPVVRPGNKRGRPSNLARQAAAAAAAAAAQLRDGDQVSPSRSQNGNSAADRDGLSQILFFQPIEQKFGQQEEWERMGFHGELQGTGQNGQNGLDQDGDAPDEAGHASGPGMKRSRRPSARILQAHDIPSEEQQVAFEGHSPEGRQGRGRGRLGKRGRGSLHHMGSPRSRHVHLAASLQPNTA
ncbi:MAG: hypothetical protein FRX49_12269 [Trebouxia sp. A1-2]|nr:MAG: hypothetical protein FRX49_12269 [Trebouxia sp. A1-2]